MKLVVDTHVHTLVSGHAYSTIQETVSAAGEKCLEMIALTEHGPAMPGAPHRIYFGNLRVIPPAISGVKILRGVEANVIDLKGTLDLDDRALKKLDFVIAGFHDIILSAGGVVANTSALVRVIANPLVDAISHPINPSFALDISEVVKAALEYDKLLEINNNWISLRPDSRENYRKMAELCAEADIPLICGSDSHISFDVGNFGNSLSVLDEARFPERLVLNTSAHALMAHLNKSRKRERGS